MKTTVLTEVKNTMGSTSTKNAKKDNTGSLSSFEPFCQAKFESLFFYY
jgi:hypothetical protein